VTLAGVRPVIECLFNCDSDSSGDYQRRYFARRSSPPVIGAHQVGRAWAASRQFDWI